MANILTAEEIAALEHSFIGPTWKRNASGKFIIPRRTLGWQIAGWCSEYLLADDGSPWRFTQEQLRFILHWYEVDEYGNFTHPIGVLQRSKGWGKDPLLAVLALVEFVGPCRFSYWADEGDVAAGRAVRVGDPVGAPVPKAWVQITAVNQAQTTNTMGMLPSLMSPRLMSTYGIKDGATLLRAEGGKRRIEAVTSSYRALEGKRTTFTVLNETHHWVSGNNGHKMHETIDGNASKMSARYLAITNAYLPGEDSVAERMRSSYMDIVEGRAVDTGFMYDSVEAHPATPLTEEALRIVIPIIRGDAVWLSVDAIIKSIQNTTIPPSRSRRMWLNQVVAEEDALYDEAQVEAITDPSVKLLADQEIALGFDGGKTDDATALVALRLKDFAVFRLGCWERPPELPPAERWEVNRDEVDSAVRHAMATYKVRAFYADVALWESYISQWDRDFADKLGVKASERSPIGWDMRSSQQRSTRAHERLVAAILAEKIKLARDPAFRRHMLNVFRRVNNWGVSFGKQSRESPRKIDLYAALLLAHEAATDYLLRGRKEPERTGRGYFF